VSEDTVAALRRGEANNPVQAEAHRLSEELLGELEGANILVIGSPMYNFGISSTLKSWFDYVLRAGRSFRYTPEGSQGLLHGKRALLVMSRGGIYELGRGQATNIQAPHLRTLLRFIGIEDITEIAVEGLGISPERRARSIAVAEAALADFADSQPLSLRDDLTL